MNINILNVEVLKNNNKKNTKIFVISITQKFIGGVVYKKFVLKNFRNSQESTCIGNFFK